MSAFAQREAMVLDPHIVLTGKALVSAGAKSSLSKLRLQIARRGAGLADLTTLGGTDQELDEAIAVLRGVAETLPQAVALKLKGFLSQRPDTYVDADSQRFIEDERVVALVKTGARKTLAKQDVAEEREQARAIHAELFGADGYFGETLLEDAVHFSTLTLLAHLTPADRIVMDVLGQRDEELLREIREISGQITALDQREVRPAPTVDITLLDAAVSDETRRLRRQRFVHGKDLVPRAEALAVRLDDGLQLATPEVKAAAFQQIAVAFARADLPDAAEPWIAKAEVLGADVTCERARIALAREKPDAAMLLLRDRTDPISRSLLIDAIHKRDGEAAALKYYEDKFHAGDLTGHALQAMAWRLANAARIDEAEALLFGATPEQVDDNPILLYVRARFGIAGTLPEDVAARFRNSDGLIPPPDEVRDDGPGQARLIAARADLVALRIALSDLDAADFLSMVDINIQFLDLNIGSSDDRRRSREALAARLADPDVGMELVPLGSIYRVEADWAPIRARLEQAEQLGGYDDFQLRAAFALTMRNDKPREIAAFIRKYREPLKAHQTSEVVVSIEIEARARSGDLEGAKELLEQERAMLGETAAAFLDTTIAETEGGDSIAMRLAQFEASGSTHDLQILVNVLGGAGDDRVGDYLIQLWQRRHQLEDARRACDLLVGAGKDAEVEAFLEELGDLAREDNHLHIHLAWARQRQGRLLESAIELRALTAAGIDEQNTRRLTIILAIEMGRWSELEPFLQKELASEADRSANHLMAMAQIAQTIDSPTTMALVRAAIAKAPDDVGLNMTGYSTAVAAGVERTAEVNTWFMRAIAGASEDGPVQKREFSDLLELVKDSHAHSERVTELINTAQVPLFLALKPMNMTQSALIRLNLPENGEATDSRHRNVLPLFAGNRVLENDLMPNSIAFDPLALLVLDHLGLLQSAISAFDDVVLPAGTLHSFFQDMGKSGPSQPSRIAQARAIKDRAASGMLSVETLPSADPVLTAAVGKGFAQLYAAAEVRDGYVIATAPLHPPTDPAETVDPARFAARLLSPLGLVGSLLAAGVLSRAHAADATAALGGSGPAWPAEPAPTSGKPFLLTSLAVQYLSDVGLLPILSAYAGSLIVLPEVVAQADSEIAAGQAAAKVRQGIERIREPLAAAIAQGEVRVGPARFGRDEIEDDEDDTQDRRMMGPVVSAMRDSGGIEALVCDDRAMNKYVQFTDRDDRVVPFLTTPDLLVILHRKNVIDDNALASSREKLRLGGAGLMPVDPHELVAEARASNWTIGPNAELRAIRDSIHLPLARRILQLPNERTWFKAVSMNLGFAIRRIWQEATDADSAERAATYLFEMIPDPDAWSANDPSPDRNLWVQDVSRTTLWAIASIFDLPEDRVSAFHQWFEGHVAPGAERRDPGVMNVVARTLSQFLTTPEPARADHA